MFAIVWSLFVSTVIGPRARPVASAASLEPADRPADGRRIDVRRLTTTLAGSAVPGNACCMRL